MFGKNRGTEKGQSSLEIQKESIRDVKPSKSQQSLHVKQFQKNKKSIFLHFFDKDEPFPSEKISDACSLHHIGGKVIITIPHHWQIKIADHLIEKDQIVCHK
jgi:hypothetical protein